MTDLDTVNFSSYSINNSRYLYFLSILLSSIGIIDTITITLSHWGWIVNLVCNDNTNQGCQGILESTWALAFGQPLSLFGFIAYSFIMLLSIMSIVILKERSTKVYYWTQRILFFTSLVMATFSLLLMSILLFKIRIFCPFCFLSATLSIALLLINAVITPRTEYDQYIFISILMSLIVSILGVIWALAVDTNNVNYFQRPIGTPPSVVSTSDSSQIALAQFLTDSDATLYSVYWCPHCYDQKELFGKEATAKLNVIECAPEGTNSEYDICKKKGITRFPSWEIKDKSNLSKIKLLSTSGIKSLNELADLSGYIKPIDSKI